MSRVIGYGNSNVPVLDVHIGNAAAGAEIVVRVRPNLIATVLIVVFGTLAPLLAVAGLAAAIFAGQPIALIAMLPAGITALMLASFRTESERAELMLRELFPPPTESVAAFR